MKPRPVFLQATVVASKNQLSAQLGDEAAILHLPQGVYYGLNDVGTWIWNRIQEPKKVRDLLRGLLKEYAVDKGRCRRELSALLEELWVEGLIEVKDETAR